MDAFAEADAEEPEGPSGPPEAYAADQEEEEEAVDPDAGVIRLDAIESVHHTVCAILELTSQTLIIWMVLIFFNTVSLHNFLDCCVPSFHLIMFFLSVDICAFKCIEKQ